VVLNKVVVGTSVPPDFSKKETSSSDDPTYWNMRTAKLNIFLEGKGDLY
jgi:hypothetical protein